MSLKIKSYYKIVRWALWSILAILLAACIIKIAIYEHEYYGSKEGSERAVAEQSGRDQELDETVLTDDQIREYKVGPEFPRYLTIEKLDIKNARILKVGINSKSELDTPINIFDTGWYEESGKPGQGGTMLIDGHNGGPTAYGVFKKLPSLVSGDIIQVERGDGEIFKYTVVDNKEIPLSEASNYMATAVKSPEQGKESLTLITCTGEWSQSQNTYLSRQFVRAVLIKNNS